MPADAMSKSNPLTDEFGKYVVELLGEWKVPSLAIAIVDGDNVYSAAYNRDANSQSPTRPDTLCYVGSTTKSFAAAALTLLADDGLLNLADPLRKHIPGFEMSTKEATLGTTIEDALSHRSGLGRHDQVYGSCDRDGKDNYTVQDLLKALPHLFLTAEPRTKHQYSNIMYVLASHIVENVSGMSFEDFLRKRLLGPLEMDSSYMSLKAARTAENEENKHLATGYFWDDDNNKFVPEEPMDSYFASGAFHMISNVLDFAKYLKAMIYESPPISKRGYEELRTPRSIVPPVEYGGPYTGPRTYTLGWDYYAYNGENVFSHGGGVPGFGTLMCYIPRVKWGIAMMANTEIRSNALEEIIWHRLMDERLGVAQEKRFDYAKYWGDRHKKDWVDKFHESPQRLYPDAEWKGPPPDLQYPEAFTGEFEHPGYQTLTLSVVDSPRTRYPNATDGPILRSDTKDRTWPFQMQFQPVNGLHFLVWKFPLEEKPLLLFKGAVKGEFHVDEKGEIDQLGISWDDDGKEDKVWFKKKVKS